MTAALTSVNGSGVQLVPRARPSDAIGSVLRRTFAAQPLPHDMVVLLERIDRRRGG